MNAYIFRTWIALSEEFSGIVQGKANDDDFGFVDTQPGFVDGQGLIFLQTHDILSNGWQQAMKFERIRVIFWLLSKKTESLNIKMKISESHFLILLANSLKYKQVMKVRHIWHMEY